MHWTKKDRNCYQCKDYNSRLFVTSQWQDTEKVSIVYLVYRWSVALFTFSVAISSIVLPKPGQTLGESYWKWFIYATHWGYLVIVLQALIGLFLVQKAVIEQFYQNKIDRSMTKDHLFEELDRNVSGSGVNDPTQNLNRRSHILYLMYRISFAAAFDLALSVTAIFWVVIYEPKDNPLDAINILMHAMNSLLMVVEASLVGYTVLWWDMVAPLAIGVGFLIFSLIYQVMGGTDHYGHPYIYRAMDWTRWHQALAIGAGAFVGTILMHCMLMMFQCLRKSIHRRWIQYCVKIRVESGRDYCLY